MINISGQEVQRSLTCFYSRVHHPYFILHPVGVEVVHPEPHLVLVYHHLLTEAESDLLAAIAEPYMKKSAVGKACYTYTLLPSEAVFFNSNLE